MINDNSNQENGDLEAGKIDDNQTEQKGTENITPGEVTEKKKKKHSSALVAASKARSAVGHAKAHSRSDVSGASSLTNTGPFVTYENENE